MRQYRQRDERGREQKEGRLQHQLVHTNTVYLDLEPELAASFL
jgi:hypothetical protein